MSRYPHYEEDHRDQPYRGASGQHRDSMGRFESDRDFDHDHDEDYRGRSGQMGRDRGMGAPYERGDYAEASRRGRHSRHEGIGWYREPEGQSEAYRGGRSDYRGGDEDRYDRSYERGPMRGRGPGRFD